MLILGLDQSITQTGWALYEFPGNERRIECGSFSCKDGDAEAQCDLFGQTLKRLIGPRRHDLAFICWERAKRQISAYRKKPTAGFFEPVVDAAPVWTVNADQLLLPEIQGMIRASAILYRIPYESVSPSTWRAALYGTGGGKLTTDAAKVRAKEYCRQLGIRFSNHNEAEAACIARWAATCSMQFRMIRAGVAA
jgi:hypothetical protein